MDDEAGIEADVIAQAHCGTVEAETVWTFQSNSFDAREQGGITTQKGFHTRVCPVCLPIHNRFHHPHQTWSDSDQRWWFTSNSAVTTITEEDPVKVRWQYQGGSGSKWEELSAYIISVIDK
jgi:hypothetical protein